MADVDTVSYTHLTHRIYAFSRALRPTMQLGYRPTMPPEYRLRNTYIFVLCAYGPMAHPLYTDASNN